MAVALNKREARNDGTLGYHGSSCCHRPKRLLATSAAMIVVAMLVIMTLLPSLSPLRLPEWLKSQPISVDETLLMLALPTALRVGLWALLISLALLLFSPEKVSAVNAFALALAAIAWGLGINFMVQALKISWRDPYFLVFAAVIYIVGTRMFTTLTTNWLLGLLLSWAVCVVFYLWAKERWQKEP